MKVWYRAVCDDHKEYCECLVRSNYTMFAFTSLYLEDKESETTLWFETHSGCALRLVHDHDLTDRGMDFIMENYTDKGVTL